MNDVGALVDAGHALGHGVVEFVELDVPGLYDDLAACSGFDAKTDGIAATEPEFSIRKYLKLINPPIFRWFFNRWGLIDEGNIFLFLVAFIIARN